VKNAMKSANRSGARFALIAGERDLADGVVQIKDLAGGEQEPVALAEVVAAVKSRLG
jgi:histidyl-tRNA synthetase